MPGLTRLDPVGIAELEPHAVGLAALHSPHTGITDFVAVAEAYAADVVAAGGEVRSGHEVVAIRRGTDAIDVDTRDRSLRFARVVVCAGLQADRVSRLADGTFIAVYDNHVENSIGYAFSKDGVHWGAGRRLAVQSGEGVWASEVRTPLGLVEEGNGLFTLFYSANEKVNGAVPDANGIVMTPGSIGVVEVRLKGNSPQADATN